MERHLLVLKKAISMKSINILLFIALALSLGCKDDDGTVVVNQLSYTGPNQDAPLFDPGLHEAAARFNSDYLQDFQGRSIESIEFYINERPDLCEVVIYSGGDLSGPDNVLYEFDVSADIVSNAWNEHILPNPIEITGDHLWIAIALSSSAPKRMIGCDSGPTIFNGDWLYTEFDGDWVSFFNRTNQSVSVNWNIRAVLSE